MPGLVGQAQPRRQIVSRPHSALVVPAITAFTLSQGPVRRTSTERRDGKFARGRVKTLAQRLGYGDAVLRAVLPLALALLSGQPDAFDPGQSLGAAHDAHRSIDLALECRRRRESVDRQRNDGVAGIGDLALLLDEIDDLASERRLVERTRQQS